MIDIQKFCAESDDIRYYLTRPARAKDGRLAASNGHIAVLLDSGDGYDAVEPPGTWVTRLLEWAEQVPATGFIPAQWDFEPDRQCEHCDGKPAEPDEDGEADNCYWCDGTGFNKKEGIKVGDAHFAKHYLRLIAALPEPEIFPMGPNDKAYFRFRGGIGFLMPIRSDAIVTHGLKK